VDDTANISDMELRTKARRLKAQYDISAVFVDYLQLMQGSGRAENRVQEVSAISRSLKGLARELDVPVVALSQLSRAVETRSPHTPILSDLRESGSIEQDADVVIFVHREEIYNPATERKNIADILVAKHRNGPTGSIRLRWFPAQTKFADLAVRPPEQGYEE
jgi:replicative DNA helicase